MSCPKGGAETHRHVMLRREGLVEIGVLPEQAQGCSDYDPADLMAIDLHPERVFSQTPGAGAGAELPR